MLQTLRNGFFISFSKNNFRQVWGSWRCDKWNRSFDFLTFILISKDFYKYE